MLRVVRTPDVGGAVRMVNAHEFGNGVAIFTRDGGLRATSPRASNRHGRRERADPGADGIPQFGGWKHSLFGDHHVHGPEGVRFYTRYKAITPRWPTGARRGAEYRHAYAGQIAKETRPMSGVQAAVAPPRAPFTLLASCLSMLALGVNGTAIMAALPTMRHDLGLNPAQVEWAINAYLVVSAACIIPGGKACDQFGARLVSVVGLALFAFASVIVATGQVPAAILAGRALQGLAAALAVPGTLAVVSESSSLERRASAISAWAGFVMLGFSLGPLIGGTLTHYLDWRVIFWASGGSMLVAATGFAGMGPAMTARNRAGRHFDAAGFALLAIGMTALVSTLHALPTTTTVPEHFLGLAGVAVVAFVMLLRHERRAQDPLIDLGLLRQTTFVRAVALGSIAMSCILALLLFYNLTRRARWGWVTPVGCRSLAAAYERRPPAFRVLRALARPAVRRAQTLPPAIC